MVDSNGPILHVLVVGFHHKKGCQVEFSFPSLVPGSPNECPPGWKYLPTLALPDGSHNYDTDTTYFHLSSLTNPKKTVFGISCYRQILAEKLKNKTDDITRSTVQKAVCVLSTIPLYGHIQVKMSLITHAYFDEGDFSKVSLLEDTYHHLNSCLSESQLHSQMFVGLSARDFILQWRHKAVLLFKLMLLEKRVIFYRSPVLSLCTTILTLLSLHPGMIENGLYQSACVKPSRPMSPIPDFEENATSPPTKERKSFHTAEQNNSKEAVESTESNENSNDEYNSTSLCTATDSKNNSVIENEKVDREKLVVEESSDLGLREEKPSLPRDTSMDTLVDVTAQNTMTSIAHVNAELCGTPLQIYSHGYLCFPYLSLPYMDLLSDINVRGYVVGATNVLFKQKKQLADVLIEIDGTRIESQDLDLRKQLHLTTEDLRFADFVVKHVSEEKHDVFLDDVGWEGGDEWIRAQFRVYLLCLLRTSILQDGSREIEHFNSSFMSAWKETHNYKSWIACEHSEILQLNPGHPFAGQLSVADMKLRLTHTIQNTEGGRKLNQAMVSTGRAVATTGRAVGGALSQAKGAISSWWSNFTTVNPEMADDNQSQSTEQGNELFENNELNVHSNENEKIFISTPVKNVESKDDSNINTNDIIVKNDILDKKTDKVEKCINDDVYKPGQVNHV